MYIRERNNLIVSSNYSLMMTVVGLAAFTLLLLLLLLVEKMESAGSVVMPTGPLALVPAYRSNNNAIVRHVPR